MKSNFILSVLLLLGAVFSLHAQDANAIVKASRNRIKADTVSTRSRMVIQAKDGTTTERLIDNYSKDGPNGARSVIVFQQPASVAGSRFLTIENKNAPDDRWIFMPNIGKIRRIAASGGSESFMGTDFSFDDISSTSRNADLDTHTLLKEENLGITSCYVIQSVPKDGAFQYSKMVQWIAKDTSIVMKIELYDKRNTLIKTVEMSGIKTIQDKPTVTVTKMTTHAAGTSTTITNEIVKYNDPIPEGIFTTSYLETGKVSR